ncbi:hypothetical protein ACUHMQ_14235 [Chitinimonas sp. PSY-7]|uniref:hypothetical protein n=1 Tax=Chitinimonas sp. PSY-7 TaxID=3459088 RepID=UPI00403FFB81
MLQNKSLHIFLAALLCLAGCATKRATDPVVPTTLTDMANRELLAYHQQLQEMPGAEQAREAKRLSNAPTNPANAMKLSLVLARSRSTTDQAQAQLLLEAVLRNPGNDAQPYHAMAQLLVSQLSYHRAELRKLEEQLAEQKKLEDTVERQSQQLRDSVKKSEQQNERLELLRTQLKTLTVKLEGLKAIERSLPNRPTSAVNGAQP